MTVVTVTNRSLSPRTFNNVNKQQVAVKPGATRDIDMDPHHVMMLQKEAQRKGSGIELKIHDEQQYNDAVSEIAAAKAAGPQPHKMGEVFITERQTTSWGPDASGGGPQEPERSADPETRDAPQSPPLEESYPIEETGAKAAAPEEEHGEDQGEDVLGEEAPHEEHHRRKSRAKSHRRPGRRE